jgi:predicted ATP-dependent endonuclease of OLD family
MNINKPMTLREIKISGLYGYIDKHIPFHHDINLLVGINGSGKTSILNIINWMLNPASLADLCVTQFRQISLKLTYKKINYELVCKKKDRQMTYQISREGAKTKSFCPLEIHLLASPESLATQPDHRKAVMERYRNLKPDEKELKSYTFLQEIPKAVILGLDRTVVRDARDQRQNIPSSAVEQVQEIANTNYSRYQSRMNGLNNQLRNQFMLSAFNVSYFKKACKPTPVELSQIQRWRERFGRYMSQSPGPGTAISRDLRVAAKLYFDKLENLLTQRHTQTSLVLLSTESQKLRRLITYLEKFENDSEEAYKPIKSYLLTLNDFFKDSSKRLLFKPDTYQICFQVLDKEEKPVGNLRNVELLSSGERQLLTLFTFIKFSTGGIYIIDEPELSLHPKWQDGFLGAIKNLMPADTQLILATHSPAIVGKNRQYCTTLLPYNG